MGQSPCRHVFPAGERPGLEPVAGGGGHVEDDAQIRQRASASPAARRAAACGAVVERSGIGQRRMVSSSLPDAIQLPSGETATLVTGRCGCKEVRLLARQRPDAHDAVAAPVTRVVPRVQREGFEPVAVRCDVSDTRVARSDAEVRRFCQGRPRIEAENRPGVGGFEQWPGRRGLRAGSDQPARSGREVPDPQARVAVRDEPPVRRQAGNAMPCSKSRSSTAQPGTRRLLCVGVQDPHSAGREVDDADSVHRVSAMRGRR